MAEYTPEMVQAVAQAMQTDDAQHYTADAAHMLEDFAATLRQQAGRVDVDRGALQMALNVLRRAGKDEVADELEKASDPASLAQNTQGEAVAEVVEREVDDGYLIPKHARLLQDLAPGTKLYLHAERARVPEFDK